MSTSRKASSKKSTTLKNNVGLSDEENEKRQLDPKNCENRRGPYRNYASLPPTSKPKYFYDRPQSFREKRESRSVFYRQMSAKDIEQNAKGIKPLQTAPQLGSLKQLDQLKEKSYVTSTVLKYNRTTGKKQNLQQTEQAPIRVSHLIDKFNNYSINQEVKVNRADRGTGTTKSGKAVRDTLNNVINGENIKKDNNCQQTSRNERKETRNVATNTEETNVFENNHDTPDLQEEEEDDFGLMPLDDDPKDNFIVEAFNDEDNELVITYIEFTRKTIRLSGTGSDNVREDLQDLVKQSDMVFHSQNGEAVKFIEEEQTKELLEHGLYTSYSEPLYYEIEPVKENLVDHQGNVRVRRTDKVERDRLSYIIDELIATERQYLDGLEKVVRHYKPHVERNAYGTLGGKSYYLFGNIDSIFEEHKKFLRFLEECDNSVNNIAQTFINSEKTMLKLYPSYSKNKPRADVYLREFREILRRKQEELNDKLDLASYLLTPIQRLGKYVILLESMNKELKKKNVSVPKISQAVDVLKRQMKRGNDYIAIDSIRGSPLSLSEYGSFIMRGEFTVLKPKRFESMVFYFENVIIITQKSMKTREEFHYVDRIEINDLSIATCEAEALTFHLMDYAKCKRDHPERHTFVLEAKSRKFKQLWVDDLAERLWAQLQKVKNDLKEKRKSILDKETSEDETSEVS